MKRRRFGIHHPRALGAIVLAHGVWALCYPPSPLGALAAFALAPAWLFTTSLSASTAFRYHFAGGIVFNTAMYYWLYKAVRVGQPWAVLSGIGLLILVFSVVHGYLGWLFRVLVNRRGAWLWYPLAFAGLEVGRTWGQMSFPWGHLGYAFASGLWLMQWAAWVGVFGLTLIALWCNWAVFRGLQSRRPGRLAVPASLVALLAAVGGARLWASPPLGAGKGPDLVLVQPSVDQAAKWDEHFFESVIGTTFAAMDAADTRGTDMVILAETAVPGFLRQYPWVIRQLARRAEELDAPILLGSLDFTPDSLPNKRFRFYNSAFLFPPGQGTIRQYSKLRLVPFSERLPFDDVFPIINYVNLGEGDFSPGDDLPVWGGPYHFSPSICYEIVYSDFVRAARLAGAEYLVNITNDGWFGRSAAPYHHANICRFRSVEMGMPVARCANSGISVFYDAWGREVGRTRLFEKTSLRRRLPVVRPRTAYLSLQPFAEGFLFWIWVGVNAAVVVGWGRRRRVRHGRSR